MTYFNNLFPTIDYDPTGSGNTVKIQDILTRLVVHKNVSDRDVLFSKHALQEHETPESLSNNYYGSTKHYWITLMINKYFDRYYDWPLTERNLQKYVAEKYTTASAIHHYEISQESGDTNVKIQVMVADYPSATPITNFEYEREVNDKRKNVKILKQIYLESFVDEFTNLLKRQLI